MSRALQIEVCVLAGGLSTRMGHDKARLKIGDRTMLARIRGTANEWLKSNSSSSRVRIIRKDLVPRCGPLGGIVTGLRTSKAQAVLFLACDMPLVSVTLLKRIARASRGGTRAVFAFREQRIGFPCLVPRDALEEIEQQIAAKEFSVHGLARNLSAQTVPISRQSCELLNINTPRDASEAKLLLKNR